MRQRVSVGLLAQRRAAAAASREGGGGTVFRLPEEEESRAADRVGPPGSDRGRVSGCWADLEAVAERREVSWVAVAHEGGEGKQARRGRKRGGLRLGQKVSRAKF
jgi:hypothetical protein